MNRTDPPAALKSPYPSAAARAPRVHILLIDLPYGSAVQEHAEVAPMMHQGWQIRRARPRIVEGQGRRHLVVLHR